MSGQAAADFFAPPIPVQPPAPAPARGPESESGLSVVTGLVVGAVVLLLSFGLHEWSRAHSDATKQLDTQIRLSLVITLAFYLVLGAALAAFCARARVRLTWVRGSGVEALLWGLPLGAVGGGLAVLLNSAFKGHLASDPNVEVLVGGGGALRIGVTLAITAVLAPLVEETVFRGIVAGSLVGHGARLAAWVSAIAFAVWHMNPTSLRYYVFVGLLLAALWRRRGLLASMAAHAAFNGVLTIAAVTATTTGGQLTTFAHVSFLLPGGWHAEETSSVNRLVVEGPGGAAMAMVRLPLPGRQPTLDDLSDSLTSNRSQATGLTVVAGSERRLQLPAGEALEADIVVLGQAGHVLGLMVEGSAYEVTLITGGSPAAEKDWDSIVRSLSAG